MNIEWKEINPDYIVSSDGQVGSRKWGKFKLRSPGFNRKGYAQVNMCIDGVQSTRKVHQLVAEAFLGPKPTPAHQVNHKNGVKSDNRDANLEWVTPGENTRHGFVVLGRKARHGAAHGMSKLTEAQVLEIRARRAAGELQRVIAADYGVTQASVSRIATRAGWGWLDG